jgi:hypothetical protein
MSFPTHETIFGIINYKNKQYDLLTNPLDDIIREKINIYKNKNKCGISTAPWSSNKFEWIVENNKLFLISIKLKLCENQDNLINNIFNTNKLFASYLNDSIKLLVSKKEMKVMHNLKIKMQRDVIILKFNDGKLINSYNKVEEYNLINLKYYIDKED